MKNKTLLVLLVIPFAVGLITFSSVVLIKNTVTADIQGIDWDYNETEGFKIGEDTKLDATAIIDENLLLADGNDLVWTVENYDDGISGSVDINRVNVKRAASDDDAYATVYETSSGDWYLHPISEGTVLLTCSNTRGTVSRSFTAVLYENGAIVINPVHASSGYAFSSSRKVGLYDLSYSTYNGRNTSYRKTNASWPINFTVYGDFSSNVTLASSNGYASYSDGVITPLKEGTATLKFESEENGGIFSISTTYTIEVVNAVNVYSYDDLLLCTNYSSTGEGVAMQVSLGSLKDVYNCTFDPDKPGIVTEVGEKISYSYGMELFGHYDGNNFSFEDEVYSFTTTYPHDYIYQFNEGNNSEYSDLSDRCLAAIRLRNNLYGNGFTINAHELSYPKNGISNNKADDHGYYKADDGDMFKGPLTFYGIGVETLMVVRSYGQDNCILYLENDSITVDDLKVTSTNAVDDLNLLRYTGSVIDIHGQNCTVKNSEISYGRTGVRAYSADGLLIDNCLISKNAEFNIKLGSDEISKADNSQSISFSSSAGTVRDSFENFFKNEKTEDGNISAGTLLSSYLYQDSGASRSQYKADLDNIQGYLDNASSYVDSNGNLTDYYNVTINDTYLWNSGLFSIAMESVFNGPLLYNGTPSNNNDLLTALFGLVGELLNVNLIPDNIGGTSKPTVLTLTGDTRIYDWKDSSSIDLSIIIEENFKSVLELLGKYNTVVERLGHEITMDDFFPIKSLLLDSARSGKYLYDTDTGEAATSSSTNTSLNTQVIYYGGALNLSQVVWDTDNNSKSDDLSLDFVSATMNNNYVDQTGLGGASMLGTSVSMGTLSRCVELVSGSHDYVTTINDKIVSGETPYLYDESPQISELRTRAG